MAVLPTFQPGRAVDPARALNVFTALQESRRRNELLEQQTQNVAQQMALEQELQPAKKATQIAQLAAAENQLKSARILADQAVLQEQRLAGLRENWDPEAFLSEFDAIKDIPDVLTRRRDLAKLKSRFGKFDAIPDAQSFMAPLIEDYGKSLEGEFQREISASDSEWFGDREAAVAANPGYRVAQSTNPFVPGAAPLWKTSGEVDKTLDRAASTSLQIAMMDGTPEALREALKDPTVRTMIGIPGSSASRLFNEVSTQLQKDREFDRTKGESAIETEADTKAAVTFKNEFFATAASSEADVIKIQRGIGLLEGGVRTGFGASFALKAKQVAEAFGIDTKNLAETEELFTILGDQVMARINQTKGAVSEKEMELFQQYSAGPGKTPEGNKKILQYTLVAARRLQTMTATGMRMQAEGASARQIRDELLRIRNATPLGIDGADEDGLDAEIKRRGL